MLETGLRQTRHCGILRQNMGRWNLPIFLATSIPVKEASPWIPLVYHSPQKKNAKPKSGRMTVCMLAPIIGSIARGFLSKSAQSVVELIAEDNSVDALTQLPAKHCEKRSGWRGKRTLKRIVRRYEHVVKPIVLGIKRNFEARGRCTLKRIPRRFLHVVKFIVLRIKRRFEEITKYIETHTKTLESLQGKGVEHLWRLCP